MATRECPNPDSAATTPRARFALPADARPIIGVRMALDSAKLATDDRASWIGSRNLLMVQTQNELGDGVAGIIIRVKGA